MAKTLSKRENDDPGSLSGLARALGVSPSTVTKDAARGMPTHSISAARQWRAENINPAKGRPPRKDKPEADPALGEDLQTARTRREIAEADKAELQVAELRGELIRRSAVQYAEEKKAAAVKESLLQFPAQLAPVVAAEADMARCYDIILEAVMGVLGKISGGPDGSA